MPAVAVRGDQTREQILDVAERMFGSEGVANVSLRQIRIAANQGNAAAVQYHFGDRDGIVRALAERHVPPMLDIQRSLAEPLAGREPTTRELVDAFVRPYAVYVGRGRSERDWMKILAELLSEPRLSLDTLSAETDSVTMGIAMGLHAAMVTRMPEEIVAARLVGIALFGVQQCAVRARIEDDHEAAREVLALDLFTTNLVDMAEGALLAPWSG